MFAFLSMGADKKANTTVCVRASSSLPQRGEGRVALEALCESRSSLWSEVVVMLRAQKVFAFLSVGADRKANTSVDLSASSPLERLQRRIALQALCELDHARHVIPVVGEVVFSQTAQS